MKQLKSAHVNILACAFIVLIFGLWSEDEEELKFLEEYISFSTVAELPMRFLSKEEAWDNSAPDAVEIMIPREGDEPGQPAMWYDSGSEREKPVLLVLHSWSEDFQQHFGIPYAVFARKNDWVFIHPDFRGEFDNKDATGSEKTVRDILQALEYARENASVDESRIYLTGFSGGAMMTLIMAGRYPERFTAASAWVPIYDLNDWYEYLLKTPYAYTEKYQQDIEASCGGPPDTDEQAREECGRRSPSAYLKNARGKDIRIFVSGGLKDPFVPPSHAIRVFNDLADPEDGISEEDYLYIDENQSLPQGLEEREVSDPFFEEAGLEVVFAIESANITLFLFDGGHDIIYNKSLNWLSGQKR